MSSSRTQDVWAAIGCLIIFGLLFTTFITLLNIYKFDEKSEVKSAYTKDAVTDYPEELTDISKDLIKGSTVLSEAISYPEGTFVKINNTVVSEVIVSETGDDYITYAKKYGTTLLDNYVTLNAKYKREVALDENGQIIGVCYTLIH